MASLPTIHAGPFHGVRSTTDPMDDNPSVLVDATDCYIPDPASGSGVYSRPGFATPFTLGSWTDSGGGGVFTFITANGTPYRFAFGGGKVYYSTLAGKSDWTTAWSTLTVTTVRGPMGVYGKIFAAQLGGYLIVNDQNYKPWAMTVADDGTLGTPTEIPFTTPTTVLSRGSTDTNIANTAVNYALGGLNGTQQTLAASAAGRALAAGTIPMDQWGIYRLTVTAVGTVTVTAGAANFTTGYATEAAAIAALPALPTGIATDWDVGYFTVKTHVGTTFIGGTDALAGGASGNVASQTNYYPGEAQPWSAWGQPEIYGGALFFILRSLNGTLSQTTIGWCEPNQPIVGYQQTTYDNAWTLTQTGATPIYALKGTNNALYYSRENAWGSLQGFPGINFRNSATHDSISRTVGCVASATVHTFGEYIYFADANGRPWRFPEGGTPEPLWLQMRSEVESAMASTDAGPAIVQFYAMGAIEPNLNVYLLAGWVSTNKVAAFDCITGTYLGSWKWTLTALFAGGCMGIGQTVSTYGVYFGGASLFGVESSSGKLWRLTRSYEDIWTDFGTAWTPTITTALFGYSMDMLTQPTTIRALMGQNASTDCTLLTSNGTVDVGSRSPLGITGSTLLSRGSTDTRIAYASFSFVILGEPGTKTANTTGITFATAGTVPINTWAAFAVLVRPIDLAVVTEAAAANFTTGYATEAAAIAAVPTTANSEWQVGYLTLKTKSGTTWIAGTDALAGGATGNPASTTNYYAGTNTGDGTWRTVWQPDVAPGRGARIVLTPTLVNAQWILFAIDMEYQRSVATVDER